MAVIEGGGWGGGTHGLLRATTTRRSAHQASSVGRKGAELVGTAGQKQQLSGYFLSFSVVRNSNVVDEEGKQPAKYVAVNRLTAMAGMYVGCVPVCPFAGELNCASCCLENKACVVCFKS